MLPSGYYKSQIWGAVHKCWLGFVIAKEKWKWDKIDLYARRIMKLERELGIELTDFSNWGNRIKKKSFRLYGWDYNI